MNEPHLIEGLVAGVLALLMMSVFFWSWVRILHRMGLSGWWILTMGLWPIMLPILATCRWPAFEENAISKKAN
jgi:hypothetical protein